MLLDTSLVRAVVVPALVFDIGPRVWWPSRLARVSGDAPDADLPAMSPADGPGPHVRHHTA